MEVERYQHAQAECRSLERQLKDELALVHSQQLSQTEYEATLRVRESLLSERDGDRAELGKLHLELKAHKMLLERARDANALGEDVKAFIAREGETLAETLGELMLVRPMAGRRMRHLNQISTELAELRSRVLGQRVTWRQAPTRKAGTPDGYLKSAPPVVVGMPYSPQRPRRSASAATVKPRLMPQEWSPMAADAFLPEIPAEPHTPKNPEDDPRYSELRELWRASEARAGEAERLCNEANAANETYRETEEELRETQVELSDEIAQLKLQLAAQIDKNKEDMAGMKMHLAAQAESKDGELQSFEAQLTAKAEAAARGERVELLHRQSTRRIANRSISRGWTAWFEGWQARIYAFRQLQQAGAMLRKPELARNFFFWRQFWEKLRNAAERKKLESQFDTQIEMMCRQFARRLLQQAIAQAWSSWRELWRARTFALALLRQAANHLRAPEMATGFYAWLDFVEQKRQQAEWLSQQQLVRGQQLDYDTLADEVERVRAECAKQLQVAEEVKLMALERQRVELVGTTEERERLRAQEDKEQRVEQMRQRWARRLVNRGIASAWCSWQEFWQAKQYAYGLLRQAGNHLAAPDLVFGFDAWLDFINQQHERARYLEMQRGQLELSAEHTALQKELKRVREEYEVRLKTEKEVHLIALERQRVELVGTTEERERMRAEEAKEQRIEEMRQRWARRLVNRGIAQAWSSWQEFWQARAFAYGQLRQAANHLSSPGLTRGWDAWLEFVVDRKWFLQQHRELKLQKQNGALDQEIERIHAECAKKLQAAEEEHRVALERQRIELVGTTEERERMRAEAAKEQRVEQMRQRWARRLVNRGIAQAWSSWLEFWQAKRYAFGLLRQAANHLAVPDLALGFNFWVAYVDEQHQQKQHLQKQGLQAVCDSLKAELQRAQREHERRLAAAEAERKRLVDKIAKLDNTASDAQLSLEAQAEAEKASRIELFHRQFTRKIMNQGLSRGWVAWITVWEARVHAKRQLREASNRLRAPSAARAFSTWCFHCANAKRAKAVDRLKDKLKRESDDLQAGLRQARHDVGQLEMVRVAQEDEIRALKEKTRLLTEDLKEKMSVLGVAQEHAQEHEHLKELYRTVQGELKTAQKARAEAELDIDKQRQSNHDLLERLLAEQRATFAVELEQLQRERELHELQRGTHERELVKLGDDHRAEVHELLAQLERAEKYDKELRTFGEELEGRIAQKGKEIEDLLRQLAAQTDRRKAVEVELAKCRKHAATLEKQFREETTVLKDRVKVLEAARPPSPKVTPPPKRERRKPAGPLGHIDLDEGPDAPPISEQIFNALHANAAKVLDLFRSWDLNGDGTVTRGEFQKAMPLLGLEVPKPAIDELFSSWDKDGGGELTLKELNTILRAPKRDSTKATPSKTSSAMQGAAKAAKAASAFRQTP